MYQGSGTAQPTGRRCSLGLELRAGLMPQTQNILCLLYALLLGVGDPVLGILLQHFGRGLSLRAMRTRSQSPLEQVLVGV